jgi:hypothetical protein
VCQISTTEDPSLALRFLGCAVEGDSIGVPARSIVGEDAMEAIGKPSRLGVFGGRDAFSDAP